jgi:hypothetical protein
MLQRLGVANQKHICNAKQKSVVQSFTHASTCTPPNKKSVVISNIATILGLLQHFLGVEIGSKFSSGMINTIFFIVIHVMFLMLNRSYNIHV